VIDMALLSVIRRWHFREGMPIREIERRTGLSRNTIRKYLRSDAVEPKFKVQDRPSKLDRFAEKLSGWLRVEAGKSRKQKRTAKQMHAETHILNLLHRLTDGKSVSVTVIDAPQALSLRREPRANVARYDTLRDKEIRHAS
jgi:transcriptional regulator with XRE-family HTH domain